MCAGAIVPIFLSEDEKRYVLCRRSLNKTIPFFHHSERKIRDDRHQLAERSEGDGRSEASTEEARRETTDCVGAAISMSGVEPEPLR